MDRLVLTKHFSIRSQQRGYVSNDEERIEELGTPISEGIVLLRMDVQAKIKEIEQDLRIARRSEGKYKEIPTGQRIEAERRLVREKDGWERLARRKATFIPVKNGHALSIYSPSPRRLKYILNGRKDRSRRRRWRDE